MAAKEDRGLARLDRIAVEIGGACDDEKLVAIDVGFGELVRLQRVLDRGRVEAETLRDALELARRRFVEAEPEEFALGAFVGNRLVGAERSEEHTSELQSLMRISYAVFCLKKKQSKQNNTRSPLLA